MKPIDKEKMADRLKELISQWEKNPARQRNGYDYEKTFVDMVRQFEKELFQESVGESPGNKNLKKKS